MLGTRLDSANDVETSEEAEGISGIYMYRRTSKWTVHDQGSVRLIVGDVGRSVDILLCWQDGRSDLRRPGAFGGGSDTKSHRFSHQSGWQSGTTEWDKSFGSNR